MTVADYEAVGRLEGSVRQEAERILNEAQPGPDDVEALHTAFVPTLVRINADGGSRVAAPSSITCRAACWRCCDASSMRACW